MEKTMTQEEKYVYMTTQPVERIIPKLAVPTIISMLVTSFYNMADTFFVGRLSTSAQAGVGVAFPVMAIIQAFGFLFGQGSGNYISRALGKKDAKRAEHMAACGFFYGIGAGIVLMALGLMLQDALCAMLGATQTSLPYTKQYLTLILIGAPIMSPSLVLNNQLRFQGNALYAMIGIVSGAVINIVLDPILMFGFELGVTGAALATIISQSVSLLLLLLGTRREASIHIRIRNFTFDKYYITEILRGGIPSLCRQGIAGISSIVLNHATACYSDAAIAGMSIVTRVSFFINSVIVGFGQGFQPVCGFNYGAALYGRVKKAFWFCVKLGSLVLFSISVIAFLFAPQVISLFTKGDGDVIAIGAVALRFNCLTLSLNAFNITANMMLQSAGRAVSASLLSLSRQGLFLIPALTILSEIFGLRGIQIAQPVSDLLCMFLSIPLVAHFMRSCVEK